MGKKTAQTENDKNTSTPTTTSTGGSLFFILAVNQILSGFFLMFLPNLYNSDVINFIKPIDNYRSAFEKIASISMISNGFSLFLIWVFNCNMLFSDVIISRFILILGYIGISVYKKMFNSCLILLAGIELVWIVLAWLSTRKLAFPSKMISNVKMPGFVHNWLNIISFVVQITGFFTYPIFIGEKFLFHFSPFVSNWSYVIGVIMISNLYIWFRAMNKTCSIYLLFTSILLRITEVCSLCGFLLTKKLFLTVPLIGYLVSDFIFIIISLLSIGEDEAVLKTIEQESQKTK
eukprot:gene8835-783_t